VQGSGGTTLYALAGGGNQSLLTGTAKKPGGKPLRGCAVEHQDLALLFQIWTLRKFFFSAPLAADRRGRGTPSEWSP